MGLGTAPLVHTDSRAPQLLTGGGLQFTNVDFFHAGSISIVRIIVAGLIATLACGLISFFPCCPLGGQHEAVAILVVRKMRGQQLVPTRGSWGEIDCPSDIEAYETLYPHL